MWRTSHGLGALPSSRAAEYQLSALQRWERIKTAVKAKEVETRIVRKQLTHDQRVREREAALAELEPIAGKPGFYHPKTYHQRHLEEAGQNDGKKGLNHHNYNFSLRQAAHGERGQALDSTIKLDAVDDATAAEQLKELLRVNRVRVIDLFTSWDLDGNGVVTRNEFERAFSFLGYEASASVVDKLFTSLDANESGSIDFAELNQQLRATFRPRMLPMHSPRGALASAEPSARHDATALATALPPALTPHPPPGSPWTGETSTATSATPRSSRMSNSARSSASQEQHDLRRLQAERRLWATRRQSNLSRLMRLQELSSQDGAGGGADGGAGRSGGGVSVENGGLSRSSAIEIDRDRPRARSAVELAKRHVAPEPKSCITPFVPPPARRPILPPPTTDELVQLATPLSQLQPRARPPPDDGEISREIGEIGSSPNRRSRGSSPSHSRGSSPGRSAGGLSPIRSRPKPPHARAHHGVARRHPQLCYGQQPPKTFKEADGRVPLTRSSEGPPTPLERQLHHLASKEQGLPPIRTKSLRETTPAAAPPVAVQLDARPTKSLAIVQPVAEDVADYFAPVFAPSAAVDRRVRGAVAEGLADEAAAPAPIQVNISFKIDLASTWPLACKCSPRRSTLPTGEYQFQN
jgi:hypothetical protein